MSVMDRWGWGKGYVLSVFIVLPHTNRRWKTGVGGRKKVLRPMDVPALCGDYRKATKVLEWRPQVAFKELVAMMVESDMKLAEEEKKLGRMISLL